VIYESRQVCYDSEHVFLIDTLLPVERVFVMFGQRSKAFFLSLISFVTFGPIVLMIFWDATIGVIILFLGLGISFRCLHLVRAIQTEGAVADQEALFAKHDRANVVYVSLLDTQGQPLDAAAARARIAAAEAQAGPRDTIIGVHRHL
jgi:hypothetical protein